MIGFGHITFNANQDQLVSCFCSLKVIISDSPSGSKGALLEFGILTSGFVISSPTYWQLSEAQHQVLEVLAVRIAPAYNYFLQQPSLTALHLEVEST